MEHSKMLLTESVVSSILKKITFEKCENSLTYKDSMSILEIVFFNIWKIGKSKEVPAL